MAVTPISKNDLTKMIKDSGTTTSGHIYQVRIEDKLTVTRELEKLLRRGPTSIVFLSHKKP